MSSSRSFLFYCAVLLVAASSVAFGLDWVSAPLPPMPETEATVQAAKLAAHVPPPRPLKAVAQVRSVYPARPLPPSANAGTTAMAQPAPIIGMVPQQAPIAAAAAPQPKCDIAACSAAYRSFRASDCSWQPYDGPRRFCDKGHPPQADASVAPGAGVMPIAAAEPNGGAAGAKCNVEACKQAYFTFNPADCTYQPSEGPRRLCEKGMPATPAQAPIDPAVAAANAANAANKINAAAPDAAKPKCNIEACKQAYFTFTPSDCTYQPSDGPRRLCTK
jgi:BA14K-like protein